MPKEHYTIRDFSGGINSSQDPRDIKENELTYVTNFFLDENGALRPSSSLSSHTGVFSNKSISTKATGVINGSAGYNLAYFETDHDTKLNSISNGAISFFTGGVSTSSGGATDPSAPVIVQETD